MTETPINPYLWKALTTPRRAGTKTEQSYFSWLKKTIEDFGYKPEVDNKGNLWVINGSDTLLTSHTDTVCSEFLKNQTQKVAIDRKGIMMLMPFKDNPTGIGQCLGADDGAGNAIMLELLANGIEVDYVFFREEEIGGLGSSWAAQYLQQRLSQYKRAIAFDRRGTTDVITHQAGTRCCSDAFAEAFSKALGLKYKPSDQGIFTDTANLVSLIPECTNISVGYYNEHGPQETLDYFHWLDLVEALKTLDWGSLPTERDPSKEENIWGTKYFDSYGQYPTIEQDMENIAHGGYEVALNIAMTDPERAAEILETLLCFDRQLEKYYEDTPFIYR